jgi:hypothetical protein
MAGMLALGSASCGGDEGNPAPAQSVAAQEAEFCTYFDAHRRESKQQLMGGLIDVAPAAVKEDLQAAHGMNEPGYESTKRVQEYIAETCSDPAPEFSTP